MKLRLLFIIVLSVLLESCSKDDFCNCTKSEGSIITETRMLSGFENIEMNDDVDVILTPDSVTYAELTCGKNLADGIETEVVNGTLVISNKNRCNWLRDFDNKFTLNIHCPKLTHIVDNGSGNLTCADSIRSNYLLVESWNGTGNLSFIFSGEDIYLKLHTGTADMQATGIANLLYIYSAGNGFVDAGTLVARQAWVNTKSTGDCKVYAGELLDVIIDYNGSVYYHGSPPVIRQAISGSGNLYPF